MSYIYIYIYIVPSIEWHVGAIAFSFSSFDDVINDAFAIVMLAII